MCECYSCKYNSGKGYCKDTSGIKINNKGMCNWHTEDISKRPKCSPQYDVGKVVEDIIEHDNADTNEWIRIQEKKKLESEEVK